MWTEFWDMSSGGTQKEEFQYCYIEARKRIAIIIFEEKFGHSPTNIICDCCGDDYAIKQSKTLEQATGYHRNCEYRNGKYLEKQRSKFRGYLTLSEFLKRDGVLVIDKNEIEKMEIENGN